MSLPSSADRVPVPEQVPATIAAAECTGARGSSEQALEDWNTYYQLLVSGRLSKFGGEFIVMHQGNVVAHGLDPEDLRNRVAAELGVAADGLVVPFVDNLECVTIE